MVKSEVILLIDDFRDIKHLASIVENRVALKRQVRREPSVRVIQCRTNDIDPNNKRHQDIEDSPNGNDQW